MKKFGTMLLFAVACTAAFADDASDKKAITAMFAKYDASISRKDFGTIRKMLAPGAKIITDGQTMKADDAMKQSESMAKAAKSIAAKTTITSITIKGDTAIVKTSSKATIIIADPQGGKKDAKIEDFRTSVDTLVRVKGAWLVKIIESKNAKTLMNGKPLDTRPPGAARRPTVSGRPAK